MYNTVGFNKHVAPITELERKEGMLLDQKTQKNFVALPEGERKDFVAALPGQHALAALTQFAGKAVRGEQVHILRAPLVRDEGHDAAKAPLEKAQPGLLVYLAQQAFLRTFALLKAAADADPFSGVFVRGFFHAVQHQHLVAALKIAKRRVAHLLCAPFPER